MKKLLSFVLTVVMILSAVGVIPILADEDYFEIADVSVADNWQIGHYHWETGEYDASNTVRACLKKLVKIDNTKIYLLDATNAVGHAFALREYDKDRKFIKSAGTIEFGMNYKPSGSNVVYISITMYDGSPLSKIQDGTIVSSMEVNTELQDELGESFIEKFKANSTLAWSDEFEGNKVDTTKWEIAKGWGRVNETWGTEEDGNVTVSDGCLKLRAYEKATSEVTNGKANSKFIQSGEVSSKAAWSEGLIEVRAKLPKGHGVYPAIWTMGRDYSINSCLWPQSGEIDIMEAVGGANNDDISNSDTWQTLHTARPYTMNQGSAGHVAIGVGEYVTPYKVPLNNDFHTFWVYMDGSIMIIGVDEYMMSIKDLNDPNLTCFKDWEQWLVLGLQMGGVTTLPERTGYSVWEMLIDYVRVYRFEDTEKYKDYKVFEAETLENSNRVTVNYTLPIAQKSVVAQSTDMNLYLKDIEQGNYDVYVDYIGTDSGSYTAYFNGQKGSTISLKKDYNAQMKYSKVGAITVEEKTDFQLKFKRNSGTLYVDKVFLIKTDTPSDIVLNNGNKVTTSDYIEISSQDELLSALGRIKRGGTIKFLSDVELTKNINLHQEMTLDLNGKTLSVNKGRFDIIIKDEVITLKNGSVTISNGSTSLVGTMESNDAAKMKVESVNFTVNTTSSGYLFNDYYSKIDVKYNNCTFNFSDTANNIKLFKGVATFNNCTFETNGKNVFLVANGKKMKFNSCVINDAPTLFYSESALTSGNVTIANTTLNNLGALTNYDANVNLLTVANCNALYDENGDVATISKDMSGNFTMTCNHSYTSATCVSASVCQYCAKQNGADPAGHKKGAGVVTKQANCYYAEITTYSCTECGEVLETVETAPIKGHTYTKELLGEQTCTTMRYYKYSCTECDYYYLDAADTDISGAYTYTGHTVGENTKVAFSSCKNHEGYYYTCSTCGKENCEYIEHIGTHNLYNGSFTAPTETTAGSATYKCKDCDYSFKKTIKKGEHIVTLDGVKYFTTDGDYITPYKYDENFKYYIDKDGKKYGADECITLTSDLTLTTLNVDEHIDSESLGLKTLTGASIRLNEKNGLRFYTEVDKQKVEELRQNGYTVELGTLITAYDLIVDRDLNFDMAKGNMVYVPYESENYYTDGSFSGIVGSLVNIKDHNLCRNFVARGYAKITDEDGNEVIVYADYDKTQFRSLSSIADAYILDANSGYANLDEKKKELVNIWAKAND